MNQLILFIKITVILLLLLTAPFIIIILGFTDLII